MLLLLGARRGPAKQHTWCRLRPCNVVCEVERRFHKSVRAGRDVTLEEHMLVLLRLLLYVWLQLAWWLRSVLQAGGEAVLPLDEPRNGHVLRRWLDRTHDQVVLLCYRCILPCRENAGLRLLQLYDVLQELARDDVERRVGSLRSGVLLRIINASKRVDALKVRFT